MEIGVLANPLAGKDIRRLTARASTFDNQEKAAIVFRMLAPLVHEPDIHVRYFADSHHIAASAIERLGLSATPLEFPRTGTATDTIAAASALHGVEVLLSLGGDGTNRAIAKGWLDAPLIAISTGTNNVYPELLEATSVGLATLPIARRKVDVDEVASRTKAVHVEIEGEEPDLALIDVVATADRFLGARAILDPQTFLFAVLTRADPSCVGMAGVAGMLRTIGREVDAGLVLSFIGATTSDSARVVTAPIAPGLLAQVAVKDTRSIGFSETTEFHGPAVLAFDGERERYLKPNQRVRFRIQRDGPRQIDVAKTLALGVCRQSFDVSDD